MRHQLSLSIGTIILAITGVSCTHPGDPLRRSGDEIVAAGQYFHTGTPVVLWTDPKGYNAYSCFRHFEPDQLMPSKPVDPDSPIRFSQRYSIPNEVSVRVAEQGWTLKNLQDVVTQFVIHYDACGTSRQCFKILHDVRGLSVQFMLDLDGTIYQTLDLKERAWHAGNANCRSVGIEIANIGSYANMDTLNQWYTVDETGRPLNKFPDWMTETGIRTPHFVARPARKEVLTGRINGHDLMQYDYTDQQYAALIKLTAALCRVFPNIRLDAPRDGEGHIRMDVLSDAEQEQYRGLLGHWHLTSGKVDPGPAFDWERVLKGARWQ